MKLSFIIFTTALFVYGECQLSKRCQYVLRDQLGASDAEDVCHNEFAQFLDCIAERVDGEVDAIVSESSKSNQASAKRCFASAGCGNVVYDGEQALDTFVPCQYPKDSAERKNGCPWRYAADEIFALLEDLPQPVSVCMVRYFKKVAGNKIEQCTQEYEPKVPDFKMPPIPGVEHLKFDDLKNVLLYQVMTRHYVGQCKCDGQNSPSGLIDCLANQVQSRADLCPLTRDCESSHFGGRSSCSVRYGKVHQSACSCLDGELAKGLEALGNWDELKRMFVGGELECNLEQCYMSSGNENKWDDMKNRIRSLKSAIIRAFAAYQSGGLPPTLQDALFVFKQIFDELKDKIYDILCGTCDNADANERSERVAAFNALWQNKKCGAEAHNNARPINIPSPSVSGSARASASASAGFDDFFGN